MGIGMHVAVTREYLRTVAILLAPVCPHTAETLWSAVSPLSLKNSDLELSTDLLRHTHSLARVGLL